MILTRSPSTAVFGKREACPRLHRVGKRLPCPSERI